MGRPVPFLVEMQNDSTSKEIEVLMPVLFVGHGSPMNAIEESDFTRGWEAIAQTIPRPKAILSISAHWMRRGTFVTAMDRPPTIHDFYGFPDPLYEVNYPAPGSRKLADRLPEILSSSDVRHDGEWGLDHGTWSVLLHMYPDASIPVVQLSLDASRSPREHYELGKELAPLREEGILILASGDIVHNLQEIDWKRREGFDWAIAMNEKVKEWIIAGRQDDLIDYEKQGPNFRLAIPTPEHYWPLLYALALQKPQEPIRFFNDGIPFGSVSMTSIRIGE